MRGFIDKALRSLGAVTASVLAALVASLSAFMLAIVAAVLVAKWLGDTVGFVVLFVALALGAAAVGSLALILARKFRASGRDVVGAAILAYALSIALLFWAIFAAISE